MIYNGDGELYEIRNFRTGRASFFAYDHAGRCMESLERSITCTYEIVYDVDNIPLYKEYTVTSYGTVISSYAYQYDVCNNLTKLTCSVAGSTWDTVYTYDADNRPLTTTLSSGKVITNTYDKLGRISKRSIGLNTAYETNLTYVAGYHTNETTSLVATYQNGSDAAYSYTYDDNGNITQIAQGTTTTTYTYDSANRLTRENNQVTNQTVTYEYDSWGNILNKKVYAYTTGALGTPTQTIPYSYTNTTWGDQLTSYNGSTIVYDSMGNPTTYRGYAMTWRGKQLTGASNGTDTLTFEYNEDGLRQSKTVNNTSTNYYYNGSVLIGMQKNTDVLRFSYNASGSVVSVTFNGTEYYYLRNAQGDIVKLIDGTGAAVVEYTYDTWGKKVQITGTLASTLGQFQPFRYRGYVYDEETGLYYLRSRYYDPEVCRFISADILLSTGQGVLGYNCYVYCLGNPAKYYDDGGMKPITIDDDDDRSNDFYDEGGFATGGGAGGFFGEGGDSVAALGSYSRYSGAGYGVYTTGSYGPDPVGYYGGGGIPSKGNGGLLTSQPRRGSGLKTDLYHDFPIGIDEMSYDAVEFSVPNGTLYQIEGSINNVSGRYEWIIQDGFITHRLFVEGGTINGIPIKP